MKVLFLVSTGPRFDLFHALAKRFVADGHAVHFAADCRFSIELNSLVATGCPISDFEDFYSRLGRNPVHPAGLEVYLRENLNGGLRSDHERDLVNRRVPADPEAYNRLKEALLIFFHQILGEGKFEMVVYEGITNVFAYYCDVVCKAHGIRYVGLQNARLSGRFVLVNDAVGYVPGFETVFAEFMEGRRVMEPELRDWCRHYLRHEVCKPPDYMSFNSLSELSLSKRYLRKEKLNMAALIARHLWVDHRYSALRGNPLYFSLQQIWRKTLRRARRSAVMRYYRRPAARRYLLYPLHFHPEASTSMQAGAYLNEYEVVRNIAFNLPEGHVLFVKDHISAYAFPSLDFYRNISQLPNVVLLSPFEDTKKLIQESVAVITLTSTVGFEALLMGKKVFLFGRTFYEGHRNVVRVGDPLQLYSTLIDGLKSEAAGIEEYNEAFLATYRVCTHEGRLLFSGTNDVIEQVAGPVYAALTCEAACVAQ